MKKLFFSIASVIAVVSCVSNQETMSELADRVFERAVNQTMGAAHPNLILNPQPHLLQKNTC